MDIKTVDRALFLLHALQFSWLPKDFYSTFFSNMKSTDKDKIGTILVRIIYKILLQCTFFGYQQYRILPTVPLSHFRRGKMKNLALKIYGNCIANFITIPYGCFFFFLSFCCRLASLLSFSQLVFCNVSTRQGSFFSPC